MPGAPVAYAGATGFPTSNDSGQTATASLQMDARTTTEYGLLRSFFDIRVSQNSPAQNGSQGAAVDKAYIQFGPWSFGKFQSFFDFYADAFNNIGLLGSDTSAVGAVYSFEIGNGVFLTAGLEDRSPLGFNSQPVWSNFYDPATGATASPFPTIAGGAVGTYGSALSTAGYRVPDGVVQLLWDSGANGWGSAQLSAAVHQARMAYPIDVGLFNGDSLGASKAGWAVQGGVKVNLGMLGAGDTAYIQAAYAQGALSYIGLGSNAPANFGLTQNATSNQVISADAFATAGGQVKLAQGFNVLAAIDHVWTPTFDTALWGSYTNVNNPSQPLIGSTALAAAPFGPIVPGVTAPDWHVYQVGAQASWVPVKGLKFAGTVNYFNINKSNATQDYPTLAGVTSFVGKKTSDGVQAAVRIQHDF